MSAKYRAFTQLVEDATKRTAPYDTYIDPLKLEQIKSAVKRGYWVRIVGSKPSVENSSSENATNANDSTSLHADEKVASQNGVQVDPLQQDDKVDNGRAVSDGKEDSNGRGGLQSSEIATKRKRRSTIKAQPVQRRVKVYVEGEDEEFDFEEVNGNREITPLQIGATSNINHNTSMHTNDSTQASIDERAVLLAQLISQRLHSQHVKTRILCLHLIHVFMIRSVAFRIWWLQTDNLMNLLSVTAGMTFRSSSAHSLPSANVTSWQHKARENIATLPYGQIGNAEEDSEYNESDSSTDDALNCFERLYSSLSSGNGAQAIKVQRLTRLLFNRSAMLLELWVNEFILQGHNGKSRSTLRDVMIKSHSSSTFVEILQSEFDNTVELSQTTSPQKQLLSSYQSLVLIASHAIPRLNRCFDERRPYAIMVMERVSQQITLKLARARRDLLGKRAYLLNLINPKRTKLRANNDGKKTPLFWSEVEYRLRMCLLRQILPAFRCIHKTIQRYLNYQKQAEDAMQSPPRIAWCNLLRLDDDHPPISHAIAVITLRVLLQTTQAEDRIKDAFPDFYQQGLLREVQDQEHKPGILNPDGFDDTRLLGTVLHNHDLGYEEGDSAVSSLTLVLKKLRIVNASEAETSRVRFDENSISQSSTLQGKYKGERVYNTARIELEEVEDQTRMHLQSVEKNIELFETASSDSSQQQIEIEWEEDDDDDDVVDNVNDDFDKYTTDAASTGTDIDIPVEAGVSSFAHSEIGDIGEAGTFLALRILPYILHKTSAILEHNAEGVPTPAMASSSASSIPSSPPSQQNPSQVLEANRMTCYNLQRSVQVLMQSLEVMELEILPYLNQIIEAYSYYHDAMKVHMRFQTYFGNLNRNENDLDLENSNASSLVDDGYSKAKTADKNMDTSPGAKLLDMLFNGYVLKWRDLLSELILVPIQMLGIRRSHIHYPDDDHHPQHNSYSHKG